MKKIFLITMCLFAIVANADNYFTIGDTLRLHPKYLGGYYSTDVCAHIDGMMDNFSIVISYPDGFRPKGWHGIDGGEDLTITYSDYTGMEQTYTAALTISTDYAEVSSYIPVTGYWDYNMDGVLEPYGTAKWTAGDYGQMFTFHFYVEDTFRSGWLTMDGHLDSGTDRRGAILADVTFFKRTWVYIGYKSGDTNGNDRYDVGDVTDIIAYVLGNTSHLDDFGLSAVDANGDGEVDVTDVTTIISWTLRTE